MKRAALLVCARALAIALASLAVVLGILGLVAAVEPGAGPPWPALAALFGPGAFAGAGAAALAIERRDGRWAGWQTMGRDPRALLLPLLAVVVLGGGFQLTGAHPITPLPAPVDASATVWWHADSGQWGAVPAAAWVSAPHELDLGVLIDRAGAEAPTGARRSVDLGELVRRFGLAVGWLVAFLAAVRVSPQVLRSPPSVLRDGAIAGGLVLAWQVLVIFSAAWVAAP